jgi:small redox-active disulfide protein 2
MLNIKVVGPGCMNCTKLEQLCREVVAENNIDANIEKISDINKFAELGILMTPGLIINNKVISSGKVPVKSTLEHWIKDSVEN